MTPRRSRSDDAGRTYLSQPTIAPDLLRELFAASVRLLDAEPWAFVNEDQKLRMDIPDLGLARAVVNVIGDVGRNRGFLIFPSAVDYEGFRTTIDGTGYIPFGTTSFGTEVLGLTFQDVTELSPVIRRGALRHGLLPIERSAGNFDHRGSHARLVAGGIRVVPVCAGSVTLFPQHTAWSLYPSLGRFDDRGSHMRLTVRVIEIVTACAGALGSFLSTHAAYFQADDPAPICGSCRRATGREVRFTVPYNASLDKSANPKLDT